MQSLTKIAVVTADKMFGSFLQRLFERNGYTCEVFSRGLESLTQLQNLPDKSQRPEAIIVDHDLGSCTGVEFCLHLRDAKEFFLTPLFLAFDPAKSSHEDVSLHSHFCCNVYFAKPPDPGVLLADIEKHLRNAWLQSGDFEIGESVNETPSQLEVITPQQAGPLPATGKIETSRLDAAQILSYLHGLKFTGRLVISSENIQRTISILKGKPVIAQSTSLRDRLGQFLIRHGWVSKEQVEDALVLDKNPDMRLGQALVRLGVLKTENLYEAIQEQTQSIIFGAFLCKHGSYEMVRDDSPNYEEIRLEIDFCVLLKEGISSCFDSAYILQRLGGLTSVPLPTQSFGPVIYSLRLDPMETKLTQLLNKKQVVREIVDQSPLAELETLQLLYLFFTLGACKFRPGS